MAKGPHNKSKQRESAWNKRGTAPQGVTRFYRVSEPGVVAVRAPRDATVQVSSGKRRDLRAEHEIVSGKTGDMKVRQYRGLVGRVPATGRGSAFLGDPKSANLRPNPEARPEQQVLRQVLALVDHWQREGQVTRVGGHHVSTTDGLHDIEVTLFVPEHVWLEDRHHALYDRLAELERDTVLITPVIHPDRLARAD